ncbi:unnamed protein product [Cuscuta epithymum]|uniref:Uncharacterized protein n=1 Tax=Cuscuta epithymum TaxID=186058 RepID=A0AAV0C150_9ASTE|nr:unnamed protein product [Cuscuta epithymum]CAH9123341.1 unnamed protein product [Cuscuta epithymum]
MNRRQSPPTVGGGNGGDENTGVVKKGPWTPEEDKRLVTYIQKHGHGSWKVVAKLAGLNRCGKSCRLRWTNYLRPDLKRGKFTAEEEQLIIKLHSVIGNNRWSAIATRLPGRTDNEIKNHWNTHLRKRLLQMGIDPTTHRPVTDFNLINVLANLTQLLAVVTNSGNNSNLTTNPDWDSINALRLCSDAAQIVNQHNLMTPLQLQLQSNTINSTAANEAQNQMVGPAAQIGGINQILDHLVLLYPSMPEVQIPRLSFIANETNQGKSVMDVSSSASSSVKIPSGLDIPNNPILPTLNYASTLPERTSSSIDWPTDKERCSIPGFPNHVTATTFEAWGDIKMADDDAVGSYCPAMSP